MSISTRVAHQIVAQILAHPIDKTSLHDALQALDDSKWERVAEVAAYHTVSQALHPRLQQCGLHHLAPEELQEHWHDLAHNSAMRNAALRAQVVELAKKLNSISVTPMLIKGSAHLFLQTYDNEGDRLSNDLDILVPASRIDEAWDELLELGYRQDDSREDFFESHHHYPPLLREGDFAAVELHHELLAREVGDLISTRDAWSWSIPLELPGQATACVLPLEVRMLHSLVHIEIVDRGYELGSIELRQLHEVAQVVSTQGAEIDWDKLIDAADSRDIGSHLRANLYAAKKLMNVDIPDRVFDRFRTSTWVHFWRTQINYSSRLLDFLDGWWSRLNVDRMVRLYGIKRNPLDVNRARLKHLLMTPFRFAKKLAAPTEI
ncbi:MAG: nucleotidyltransferase family protein [Pseudomonadota bacterium]